MYKLGIIGFGNMGGAIIRSLVAGGVFAPEEVLISELSEEKRAAAEAELGAAVTASNREAVSGSEMVLLAVKPQFVTGVLEEIADCVRADQPVISIVAGKDLAFLESYLGADKKIIRTMPTTSALVGESCSVIVPNANVTAEETGRILEIYRSFGKAEIISEQLMNAFTAVSSSPASVFMMIEALADGAVACGLPRDMALRMVAQTVMGSAKMALETGKHPGELKDMVCSPAGTTIELVNVLEESGFRGALMDSFRAAAEKSASL
ncbi:MAG: pyrroline-5-carboxylate reductase [Lachnospiraceae bacterium]|nr:pyrroline-5-carboxylate reductase [Lachnospiraceae bacterium]MBR0106763.1 pyrroline-5-carboxylate reductase [Lachnospiraceae bacterium]